MGGHINRFRLTWQAGSTSIWHEGFSKGLEEIGRFKNALTLTLPNKHWSRDRVYYVQKLHIDYIANLKA